MANLYSFYMGKGKGNFIPSGHLSINLYTVAATSGGYSFHLIPICNLVELKNGDYLSKCSVCPQK